MGKYDEKVADLFGKHVKPMKLPPRLAGQIKIAMESAAKKSKGDTKATKAAIGEYLTERGYDPSTGKKLDKKAKKTSKEKGTKPKTKKAKRDKEDSEGAEKPSKEKSSKKPKGDDPAKDALVKAGAKAALKGDPDRGVPAGNIDLTKLERRTLKGMAKDLGASYSKSMSDDEVRASVASKMIGMDDKAKKLIASADPAKIDGLDSCVGLFMDLTQVVCITCPSQEECRRTLDAYRKDGFKVFEALQPGAAASTDVVPVEALTKKSKKKDSKTDDKPQAIKVVGFKKVKLLPKVEVDGKKIGSNMEHKEFLRELKSTKPVDINAFRALVLEHYEASDEDKDGSKLASWFLRYCKALGVVAVA